METDAPMKRLRNLETDGALCIHWLSTRNEKHQFDVWRTILWWDFFDDKGTSQLFNLLYERGDSRAQIIWTYWFAAWLFSKWYFQMCQKNGSIASFYSAASKSIAFQAGLRPPQQLKLPATRFISNVRRVSYVSDDAVLELPFPWSLCYIVLTLPCRSLDESPNTAELCPRIASLQESSKIMKLTNMLVAIARCDRPLSDRRVPVRTQYHDKSFLSALLASMHEFLLDMVHSGWCIV